MRLFTLSGKALYWSILSGGKKIIEHQEEINKINVFPVADGDTGANLAATATSIIYNSKEEGTISDIASSIGDAALDGARGNSGVIFAQFLYGIGLEIQGNMSLNTQKFASIVKKASEYVYKSIPSPQEGTIITVIRVWADFIHAKHHEFSDFDSLLEKAQEVANKALLKTTEQLEVLKLAKVVDAGAKGFVLFIEGMKETILNRAFSRDQHNMEHLTGIEYDLPISGPEVITEESLHNRFCTETCIIGENIPKEDILKILEEDSDSIVIAGSDQKLRLHFHTNNPALIFKKLNKFGNFSFQKVDDMRLQYNVSHNRKSQTAFVVDSGVSLSAEFIEAHQIHLVPITIKINNNSYYDIKSIDLEIFQQYLLDQKPKISTSQPSPKVFADLFSYLDKHYDSVIVLSMSSGVSGTFESAKQGKNLVKSNTSLKIEIIDSRNLAAGAAVIAHKIAKDIEDGVSSSEIINKINHSYIPHTNNFVNIATIDHLVNSGRISLLKGSLIKALKLSPVVEMKDGKPFITGKAFGLKQGLQKTLKSISKLVKNKKTFSYVVTHTFLDESTKTEYLEKIKKILGSDPLNISLASPSIANHVGMGAICVGILETD